VVRFANVKACPKCDGTLFEASKHVDDFHADGDWYEHETTSCLRCGEILDQTTVHCSEHGPNNEHYDGTIRSFFRMNDQGRAESVRLDELYETPDKGSPPEQVNTTIVLVNDELKRILAKYPERMYDLNSRKFEELVADILRDFGWDVEMTKATRDGGVDLYVYIRNEIIASLMIVECKRWAPNRAVGIDRVQRLRGVQETTNANISMLVTTSHFTQPAIAECRRYEHLMALRDYQDLKRWLERYR